ncbi:MAG: hypothetical protein QOD60_110 [Solirubrobacterales bacterium]|nr:hypothetical protein [Solirubrobacterales bacterium]
MVLGRNRWRQVAIVFVVACLVALGSAAIALAGFNNPASNNPQQQFGPNSVQRQDTPNDPGYDGSEPDRAGGPNSSNLYDERFDLFGFPSLLTSGALTATRYREGPHGIGGTQAINPLIGDPQVSGFNAAGAWKIERGRPDVTVAILDTGIKWDREGLRTKIHLNKGELPTPAADGASCPNQGSDPYDCNGDGVFNVDDYANDPNVSHTAGPHGSSDIDAEDLIATFSDGTDHDGNGFVDDIAGWDFFDNDNDPYDASSYFAAAGHGSGRASEAVERGDDGQGGIGVCPGCQMVPIRTWDTFVSDGNTFGMGITYATDNGVSVIEGANGSVYHSAFAEAASNYAYSHGVVQMFSGDDLNTGNHNYPANYGHAQLVQGTVPDTVGLGTNVSGQLTSALCNPPLGSLGVCLGTNLPVGTYFRGANTTQYGGKSSISMEGATGSENTGKSAGAAALVVSAARSASIQLRPDETRSILEQTAERVLGSPANPLSNVAGLGVADPGADPAASRADQWTSHFGWGRVNLGAAVAVASSGKIPPEAAIDSPDWYAPETGSSMHVTGLARARFATGNQFHYKVQWGAGEAPASWNTVSEGDSSTAVTDLGNVDLSQVRSALASYTPPLDPGGPTFSALTPDPFKNEFTVRIVVDGQDIATPGIDRRVFTSAPDPSLRPDFPKRLGTGGEAPLRYADVNGDNVQELIVPTEDGTIHAYEPDGSELPGWPAHTQLLRQATNHLAAPGFGALDATAPPREPLRGAAVADLDNDGRQEVIDTAGTHLYVWEPDGSLRPGFPVEMDLSQCAPSQQSQPLHHPKCGFVASPAVGRLEGQNKPLDIVAPALDGRLYAFDGAGNTLPNYPVRLQDPNEANPMVAEAINEPAIEDLNGDGKDDVVVASNESYAATPPALPASFTGFIGQALTDLLANAAGGSSRVYAVDGASGNFLPGWPIKLNGAIQTTLPFIGPGENPSIATIGGQKRIVASTTGSTTIGIYSTGGSKVGGVDQTSRGPASDVTIPGGSLNLFESASLGKLLPAGDVDIVKYGLGLTDAVNLLLAGQNLPYNHQIGAYDSTTGQSLPAFPRITDDFQFLSSSDIAKVDKSLASNQVIAGTGLGLLHAYDGVTGLDAPGFPKITGGWLFAPAAFSNDGRMADITREGYLFQWNLPNLPECQTEWPSFRHDQQQSGNYDRDGTQPSTPTDLALNGATLSFKAPGDDYGCGTAASYEIVTSGSPIDPTNFAAATPLAGAPAPQADGTDQSYALPAHQRYVAIRAIDDAGNVGWSASLDAGTNGGGGGGGANPGGTNPGRAKHKCKKRKRVHGKVKCVKRHKKHHARRSA